MNTGECILGSVFDDSGRLTGVTVLRADPRVLISDELVTQLGNGYGAPFLSIDGDVWTIQATDRTLVYRIDRDSFDPLTRCYVMEWPD